MSQFLYMIRSLEATHFTEPLAQNAASAMYNLPGIPIGGAQRFIIRAIAATAKENFGPEFNFFQAAAGFTVDPATDVALSRWAFTSANGEQLGGSGLWRYYVDGLNIPYFDADAQNTTTPGTLHVKLQNVSATAKLGVSPLGGTAGTIVATFWLEPMASY